MADAKKKAAPVKKVHAKKPTTAAKKQPVSKKITPKEVVETPKKEVAVMSAKEAAPIFGHGKSITTTGKRKTAIVRVRLFVTGDGKMQINGKPLEKYFVTEALREVALSPLAISNNLKSFDVSAIAIGGGTSSQAQALRHALARAMLLIDETLKKTLKKATMLTRDARVKERKKYGLHRARRGPQFSKR